MKFTLSTPIKAHGDELSEIELREPTTKDVRELGYPFSATPGANGDADLKLFPDIAAKHISRLAGIPMSSVDQIHPGDFLLIHTELCGFFGQGSGKTSTNASSTSPASGE